MSSKSTFSNSTAKSYAVALYEISKENSVTEEVESEMYNLQKLVNENSNFKDFILSPVISKGNKQSALLKIAELNNFTPTSKNFLGFIINKNRLFFLAKIIESFLNLTSYNKGELKAKFISSKELTSDQQKKIQDELSKDFKSQLNIDYKCDPTLLGGLIIQIGSIMVDASIKNKLKKLETKMVEV